jgi:hypothetical protein
MPSELGEFIEEEDATMGQRYLARQHHLAPANRAALEKGRLEAWNNTSPLGQCCRVAGGTVGVKGLEDGNQRHCQLDNNEVSSSIRRGNSGDAITSDY